MIEFEDHNGTTISFEDEEDSNNKFICCIMLESPEGDERIYGYLTQAQMIELIEETKKWPITIEYLGV